MNHDITHCQNEDCRDKFKCYRYAAYKEIVEKSIDGYYSFYFNNENVTCKEECKIPWIKNESCK